MLQADTPTGKGFFPLSSCEQKRDIGRRTGWTVLLVPLVIILITASTRYLFHPVAFDVFCNPPTWDTLVSKGMNWTPHKRHPLPEPQIPSSSTTTSSTPSSSTTVSQPIPTIPSSPPTLPTPFPQPFDSDLSRNFSTVSCSNFLSNMTNALDFRSCRPFSLLSSTSATFINAQYNYTLMNTLIWGTCNTTPSKDQCVATMSRYVSALRTECSQELAVQNVMVLQTLTALEAYGLMRDTACLDDPTRQTYCFINAVCNPDPTELYYYQLPLGSPLPQTTNSTCSQCTASVLSDYAQALRDPTQAGSLTALKKTYDLAAALTVKSCGSTYATVVPNGAVVALRPNSSVWAISAVALLGYTLLLFSPYCG